MRTFTLIGVATILLLSLQSSEAKDRVVRVWMRAFIPNQHASLPDFIKKTSKGTFVIDAPIMPSSVLKALGKAGLFMPNPKLIDLYAEDFKQTCFETDNRGFASDPDASSRVSVELVLNASAKDMTIADKKLQIGPSRNVDCKTGKLLRDPKTASLSGINVGDVKKDGWYRTLFVRVATANPYYGLPDIDFSYSLRFDPLHQIITIKGSTGAFPAYEAYWNVNDGPVKTLLERTPQDKATPFALFDLNLGFNTVNFNGEMRLLK